MQLMRRKSDSSFYESFSDLIFCALVLFVALVMVLAANVGAQVDSLKTVKADLEQSKEKLKSAVNSHRYSGASSIPSLSISIDIRENEPRFFFTPRALIDSFTTPMVNETQEQGLSRQRNAIIAITENIEQQRGLTKDDFRRFLKAFSYHTTAFTDRPWLGIEVEEIENHLTISKVYPYSKMPADQVGATLLQIEDKPIQTLDELQQCFASFDDREFASVLVEKNASRVELKVKVLRHLYDGIDFYMVDAAHAAASGWRLVGKELEMAKDPNASGNLSGREKSFEQTLSLAREVFADESQHMELGSMGTSEPVTLLQMRALETEQKLLIGDIPFELNETIILLRAIANGNVAVEFVDENNQATSSIPAWVHTQVLNPAGYINRAPDLEAIEKWLVANGNN